MVLFEFEFVVGLVGSGVLGGDVVGLGLCGLFGCLFLIFLLCG